MSRQEHGGSNDKLKPKESNDLVIFSLAISFLAFENDIPRIIYIVDDIPRKKIYLIDDIFFICQN